MFDSLHPILLTPNSLHAVPTSFDADQLRTLRIEASARSLDYLRRTPPEEYGVHPLGFLNILLFESRSCRIRIHVWHDRLFMPTSPYKIHDHSYSSYSVILAGRLRNSIYHEDSNSSGDRSDYFVANATPGSTNTNLQFTDNGVARAIRRNGSLAGLSLRPLAKRFPLCATSLKLRHDALLSP